MCSWHAHLSSPAAFPGRTSSQGASQVLRAIEPADIPIWLKRLDPGRTKTAEELDALLGEDSNRLLRWACCALACSYPVTRRTGLPNRSSAHSVPPCACATDSADTVSCNDEHYVLCPVFWSICSQTRLRARAPPRPSLVSGGWWNTSSAHSAPPCACATETVSCNDMSARPHPVLSLTCAHWSTLISGWRPSWNSHASEGKKWTTTDRSFCAPRLEVRSTF